MVATGLSSKHCAPCNGEVPRLTADAAAHLLPQIAGWAIVDETLQRRFVFKDFVAAMRFVNQLAEIAEAEGHHPDFTVHYRQVDVTIWTHEVGGLTENDFILAAKIGTP